MSVVTDIILTSSLDGVDIAEVNRFLAEHYGGAALYKVDKPEGAPGKAIQADIFIGAFNYMDVSAFVAHLRSLDWKEPGRERDAVRLFIQEEHDEHGFMEEEIWEASDV